MELLMGALEVFTVPQIIAGLVGGSIGAGLLLKSYVPLYGWGVSLLFAMIGLISSGAAAEYAFLHWGITSIFLSAILGAISGVVGASGIDALRLASPQFMRDLIDGSSESLVTKLISLITWKK